MKTRKPDPLAILRRPLDADGDIKPQVGARVVALAGHYRVPRDDWQSELAMALLADLISEKVGRDLRDFATLTIKDGAGPELLIHLIGARFPGALDVERRATHSRSKLDDPLGWRKFASVFEAHRDQPTPELRNKAAAMERWLSTPPDAWARFTGKRSKRAICYAASHTKGPWRGEKAESLRDWLKVPRDEPHKDARKVHAELSEAIVFLSGGGLDDSLDDAEADEAQARALEDHHNRTWKRPKAPRTGRR